MSYFSFNDIEYDPYLGGARFLLIDLIKKTSSDIILLERFECNCCTKLNTPFLVNCHLGMAIIKA